MKSQWDSVRISSSEEFTLKDWKRSSCRPLGTTSISQVQGETAPTFQSSEGSTEEVPCRKGSKGDGRWWHDPPDPYPPFFHCSLQTLTGQTGQYKGHINQVPSPKKTWGKHKIYDLWLMTPGRFGKFSFNLPDVQISHRGLTRPSHHNGA